MAHPREGQSALRPQPPKPQPTHIWRSWQLIPDSQLCGAERRAEPFEGTALPGRDARRCCRFSQRGRFRHRAGHASEAVTMPVPRPAASEDRQPTTHCPIARRIWRCRCRRRRWCAGCAVTAGRCIRIRESAAAVGFSRPILHGPCTYVACKALDDTLLDGNVRRGPLQRRRSPVR